MGIPSARYARGLLVRVSLDRFGRELLRKSQTDLTQLMKRREELGEGACGGVPVGILKTHQRNNQLR